MSDPTESVVERVAQAIGERLFGYYESLEAGDSSSSAQARLAARAAIEAMREPTEAMVNAAWDKADIADADDAWRAMIDECLK